MPDSMFTTDAMRAVFDDASTIQCMLDVERALARAEAAVGVIPTIAAEAIARHCIATEFDIPALKAAARNSGNLAIPLVDALTRAVGVDTAGAGGYVHWGATSQDIIDTGLVLQLRSALILIETDVERMRTVLREQTVAHRRTVLAGRTLLQHALPVTLGLKLAGVLDAMDRHRDRLVMLRMRVSTLQFGGAAGTLASLGSQGVEIEQALATELDLVVAATPWHTQRDRLCEVATTLGLLTATLGKLARDLALLSQTEVAEAFEALAPGRGGSSTMPQKRNPVAAAIASAAAVQVPGLVATMLSAAVQEHERGVGNWHAEWETLPAIVLLAAGALDAMVGAMTELEVDGQRMRANLELTRGQLLAEAIQMALAPSMGRDVAHALVAGACKRAMNEGAHLREILAADPRVAEILDNSALSALFDPERYLGSSDVFIDRVLNRP